MRKSTVITIFTIIFIGFIISVAVNVLGSQALDNYNTRNDMTDTEKDIVDTLIRLEEDNRDIKVTNEDGATKNFIDVAEQLIELASNKSKRDIQWVTVEDGNLDIQYEDGVSNNYYTLKIEHEDNIITKMSYTIKYKEYSYIKWRRANEQEN